MKIELNPIFGKVRGKLGNIVFKQINGTSYIARCPVPKSKSSLSPSIIAQRKRFGLVCKLAKSINQINIFKNQWRNNTDVKMNTYIAIQKENFPLIGKNELAFTPKLTPFSENRDFSECGFSYHKGEIAIEFNPDKIELVKDYDKEKFMIAAGVIYLSEPVDHCMEDYKFISVVSKKEDVSKDETTVLSIELNGGLCQLLETYTKCIFHFGFVSLDKDSIVINTISTFAENLYPDNE